MKECLIGLLRSYSRKEWLLLIFFTAFFSLFIYVILDDEDQTYHNPVYLCFFLILDYWLTAAIKNRLNRLTVSTGLRESGPGILAFYWTFATLYTLCVIPLLLCYHFCTLSQMVSLYLYALGASVFTIPVLRRQKIENEPPEGQEYSLDKFENILLNSTYSLVILCFLFLDLTYFTLLGILGALGIIIQLYLIRKKEVFS